MFPVASIRKRNTIADNVAGDLRRKIEAGICPLGSRLPGRRSLAMAYGVAPLTIQQAMSALMADGLIRAEAGRGTFVARSITNSDIVLGKIGVVSRISPGHLGQPARTARHMLLSAAERAISDAGGTALFFNRQTQAVMLPHSDAIDSLAAQQVNAIVFVEGLTHDTARQAADYCRALKLPLIVLTLDPLQAAISHAKPDDIKGGEQAANHLIERGCRSLLYVSPVACDWAALRLTGVRNAVLNAGAGIRVVQNNLADLETGLNGAPTPQRQASSQEADFTLFDGVVCSNDRTAILFIEIAKKQGLEVGRDYLIAGFDDSDEGRAMGISSMQMPIAEIAQCTAGLLREALRDPAAATAVTVPYHLVARTSTLWRDKEHLTCVTDHS
ncbi:MAG: GntR family transcriptional regulator [Capsulimonadaceae bacterium]|nr:GntR family transcriptional regulator [Capsulimonadaceae bacterium]